MLNINRSKNLNNPNNKNLLKAVQTTDLKYIKYLLTIEDTLNRIYDKDLGNFNLFMLKKMTFKMIDLKCERC